MLINHCLFDYLVQELRSRHGAEPVERAALDEDEDVEVGAPQLVAAPLHAHVLQHGTLADARRSLKFYQSISTSTRKNFPGESYLDCDDGGERGRRPGHAPAGAEHVFYFHALEGALPVAQPVVVGLAEVLNDLGTVVHVQLGRLLRVHLELKPLIISVRTILSINKI